MHNLVGNIIWYENIEIQYVDQLRNLNYQLTHKELTII
jgi:hypothetical protein